MILKHTSVGECQRSVVVEARGAFRCWMNNCVSETASLCLCICGRRKLLLLLSNQQSLYVYPSQARGKRIRSLLWKFVLQSPSMEKNLCAADG